MSGNIPNLGTRSLVLGMFLLFNGLQGCTTYTAKPDLPCPDRPVLTAIPEDLQLRMPEDVVFIVGSNQLLLKTYAKKLEVRAGCDEG